jgi:hypothetical protein
MKLPPRRMILAVSMLAAGALLFASGYVVFHKVHDIPDPAFDLGAFGLVGVIPFRSVSEKDLLLDATSTGVVRKDGELYSTYDRSAPHGKRKCPT